MGYFFIIIFSEINITVDRLVFGIMIGTTACTDDAYHTEYKKSHHFYTLLYLLVLFIDKKVTVNTHFSSDYFGIPFKVMSPERGITWEVFENRTCRNPSPEIQKEYGPMEEML